MNSISSRFNIYEPVVPFYLASHRPVCHLSFIDSSGGTDERERSILKEQFMKFVNNFQYHGM